jgi:hypothetical protein
MKSSWLVLIDLKTISSSTFAEYNPISTLDIFSSCIFRAIRKAFVLNVAAIGVVNKNFMSSRSSIVSIPVLKNSSWSIGGSLIGYLPDFIEPLECCFEKAL